MKKTSMMRKHLVPGSVAAFLAATGLASAQQQLAPADTAGVQSGFSLTTGVDYTTGTYGGASSTDIVYVPLTGRYEIDKGLFKLTVPYIMVTGPGNGLEVPDGPTVVHCFGHTCQVSDNSLCHVIFPASPERLNLLGMKVDQAGLSVVCNTRERRNDCG
jgi:hypothetical protein